jgi:hypothetical protein
MKRAAKFHRKEQTMKLKRSKTPAPAVQTEPEQLKPARAFVAPGELYCSECGMGLMKTAFELGGPVHLVHSMAGNCRLRGKRFRPPTVALEEF